MTSWVHINPAWLLMLALNACAAMPTYNPNGCIYDATTDQRSMVFNFRTHWMSFQYKQSANVGSSSEFGGYFNDCSDSSYYCLSGPLSIVIPIMIRSNKWRHGGASCELIAQKSANSYEISCTDASGRKTYVDYSPRHGISAIHQVSEEDNVKFVLRGDCGIFCGKRLRLEEKNKPRKTEKKGVRFIFPDSNSPF